MSAVFFMNEVCPHCGGKIECTVVVNDKGEVYVSLDEPLEESDGLEECDLEDE